MPQQVWTVIIWWTHPGPPRMSWYSLNADDLRRPRIQRTSRHSFSSQQSYQTPELGELQRMLWTPVPCRGNVNEVWPNLYIGDLYIARDIEQLRRLGITHIVNAAAGRFHIDTGAKFYRELAVDYYGIEADDDPKFDLSIYFYPTAKYIRAALNSPKAIFRDVTQVSSPTAVDGPETPEEFILS
ncbi:dual specificity protein phosphatase 13B isoform 3-T5 [Liasis olivaceus]